MTLSLVCHELLFIETYTTLHTIDARASHAAM